MANTSEKDNSEGEDAGSSIAKIVDLLYSRFLLRDIIGKVMPGMLFFSLTISILFRPFNIIKETKEFTAFQWFLCACVCWIFTISTQGLHTIFINFYYPRRRWRPYFAEFMRSKEQKEATYLAELFFVDKFKAVATAGQNAQYERFLVIKEACGNTFSCMFLAVLISGIGMIFDYFCVRLPFDLPYGKKSSVVIASILFVIIFLIGLRLMHREGVLRQSNYAHLIYAVYLAEGLDGAKRLLGGLDDR